MSNPEDEIDKPWKCLYCDEPVEYGKFYCNLEHYYAEIND